MNVARELIVAGRSLDADRAYCLGLLNQITEAADLLPEALRWANEIAAGPLDAMAAAKRLLDDRIELHLPAALELEIAAGIVLFTQAEAREGLAAFAARHPPRFTPAT